MRVLVRFLARLYPARWRQRYGAEFEALLEDSDSNAKAALNVLAGAISMQVRAWNVGKILAASGLCGLLVAGGIAWTLPRRYASSSLLSVTAPQDLWTRFSLRTRAIQSRESLTSVVRSLGLYPRERLRMPLEDVIDGMRRNIHIGFLSAHWTDAEFFIQFEDPDPAVAQKVTTALTRRLVEENLTQSAGDQMLVQVLAAAKLPQQSFPITRRIAAAGLGGGLALGGVFAFLVRRARVQNA